MKFKSLLLVLVTVLICLPFLSYGQGDIVRLRQKAEQGNATAQYNLGDAYYFGDGVSQDYKEAVKWFRLSAEQGDARAQGNLGYAYVFGEGIPQDYTEAVKWCRLAAEQGDAKAQTLLGAAYALGQGGIPQDYTEAVKWWKLAAEQEDLYVYYRGHGEAQYNLGVAYAKGEGVSQDYTEAVKWWKLAAEQGNAKAQCNLGVFYYTGKVVPQDYTEAVKWFRLSAEQGDAKAQGCMAVVYSAGEGVTQDYAQAYAWFNQGDKGAAKAPSTLLELMTPSQIREGQRLSRELTAKIKKSALRHSFDEKKFFLGQTNVPSVTVCPAQTFVADQKEVKVRFTDQGDGTVTDNMTGLMWTKNANHGQMTWAAAVEYCDDLVTNGFRDWRLPSVAQIGGMAELDTLFRSNGNPSGAWEGCAGTPFTGVQSSYYWSGTSRARNVAGACYVFMGNGNVNYGNKTSSNYVWPVRGGQ